ncbi:MAG: hypothetical protein RR323_02920 [Raoultibacter sp.]
MSKIELRITAEFVEDTTHIYSERVFNRVYDDIDKLRFVSELGSRNVPSSVLQRYGEKARKLVMSSFDIIYTYDKSANIIEVKALVHQRNAPSTTASY